LKDALLGHLKNIPAKSNNDPSWLFALPLYHFVSGLGNPFDALNEDLSHADKKPVWWGIADVEFAVNTLKISPQWKM